MPYLSTQDFIASTRQPEAWRDNPNATKFIPDVERISYKTGIPAGLFGALIDRESKFNPKAVSPAGAQGIAQLMPIHNAQVDPMNPKESMKYAAKYLVSLKGRFGTWDKALAAYNHGPTNVSKLINQYGERWKEALPPETVAYIAALDPTRGE